MKNLKSQFGKLLIAAALVFFGYTETKAQNPSINSPSYRTAIGLRAGGTSGLTIKHFVASNKAVEGIIGTWPNAASLTGLFEWHAPAASIAGFNWYYGIGAHATVYRERYFYYRERPNGRPYRYYDYRGDGFGLGIDGIVGIEYKINPIPFAISLDLKPFVEIGTNNVVYTALDPGLGIKFTF